MVIQIQNMKTIITKLLGKLGHKISRLQAEQTPAKSMEDAIKPLAKNHTVNTIIDKAHQMEYGQK